MTALAKNHLINGDMDVWQDQRSWSGISNNTIRTMDMGAFAAVNAGVWSIARDADVPSKAATGKRLKYSIKCTCTTSQTSLASNSQVQARWIVPGHDFKHLLGNEMTFVFWVKTNKLGLYGFGGRNDAETVTYSDGFTVNVADEWEEKSITIPSGEPFGDWNFDTREGIRLQIGMAAGSGRASTSGQWNSGYFVGVSGQDNLADTTGNYMNLAGLRLVAGGSIVPVETVSVNERMDYLRRFFRKSYDYDSVPGSADDTGRIEWGNVGSKGRVSIEYDGMNSTPVCTAYSPATGAAGVVRNGSTSSELAATFNNVGEKSATLVVNSGVSDGNILSAHYTLDARL